MSAAFHPARTSVATGGNLALVTLCLAVLVAQVDTAVVNLAIEPIGRHFHARIGTLQWVLDSYNLLYAALLLTGGLLADLFGRRLIFNLGAAIFTAASMVCALAPSIGVLIGGRTAAGLGAALLIPASLAIIRVLWQDNVARGRALGVWAACNGLAMAIGPTLGGVLIHQFGWRSIFLVVVPFSLAACLLSLLSIPESADPRARRFDLTGQVLGAAMLGAAALAAIEGSVAALVAALVALAAFLRIELRRGEAALVPLELFRSKPFSAAMAATCAMTFGMYGVLFLLPLTWQGTGRLDAAAAGLALMPMALIFVVISPLSGRLTEHVGARVMRAGGLAVIGAGLLTIGASAGSVSLLFAEIGLTLTGIGMGLATGPLMEAAMGAVSEQRSGTASALINVARMVGATIGVATAGAVYAIPGGGTGGLRLAMLLGGGVQVATALAAFAVMRPAPGTGPQG